LRKGELTELNFPAILFWQVYLLKYMIAVNAVTAEFIAADPSRNRFR
jgi:hypothetical protein